MAAQWRGWAMVVLLMGGTLAYLNTFAVPFLYDDAPSIVGNETIRTPWRLGELLAPPAERGATVGGRPVLNVSLAVDYAISGLGVWSYHATNLAIHLMAGLMLFGILRRTMVRRGQDIRLTADPGGRAGVLHPPSALAATIALLWIVHPLQTEAVTYVVQRAESLMGLFYLATLYFFIRGAESSRPRGWYVLSAGCCLLGMGTKENMVSAPLAVMLYDWIFLSGVAGSASEPACAPALASTRGGERPGTVFEPWRRRNAYYAALIASWVLLGYLVYSVGGDRGGSIGFGLGLDWWEHFLVETRTLCLYLKLSLWPRPLVFEYGAEHIESFLEVAPFFLIVAGLAVATVVALWRRRPVGLLGFVFFAVLAPNVIIPGPLQMTAEHRMYLPLAAVLVLVVLGIHRLVPGYAVHAAAVLAVGAGFLTWQRNHDYRSAEALWADTVEKRPGSPQAHNNYGAELAAEGRLAEATKEFEISLRLGPQLWEAHVNYGNMLLGQGKFEEAIRYYEPALAANPRDYETMNNVGIAWLRLGRPAEAVAILEAALKIRRDPPIEANLALARDALARRSR